MKKIKNFSLFFESHDNYDLVEPITDDEYEKSSDDFVPLNDYDKRIEIYKLIYKLSKPVENSQQYYIMYFTYSNGINIGIGLNNDFEMFIAISKTIRIQAYRLDCGFGFEEPLTLFFEIIKNLIE